MEKIPFDLERFKAGDVAMTLDGQERYAKILASGDVIAVCARGLQRSTVLGNSHYEYVMKPTSEGGTEDWIKHDGGPCPIPWAKNGELQVKFRDGQIGLDASQFVGWWEHESGYDDNEIIAYRLTDGWHPVKGDGTIPEAIKGAKAGEWEYKMRKGDINTAYDPPCMYGWADYGDYTFVAVRLIQSEDKSAIQKLNDAEYEKLKFYRETVKLEKQKKETPQQALTRAAYLRYKAAHPQPLPAPPAMGEDGLMAAMAQAVKGHKI